MIPRIVTTVAELRSHLDDRRRAGALVGVVPTMGALHEGHLSLVQAAADRAQEVVVTIFVNPTQFGPGEDFERYPRDLEADARLAASAGATTIFAPSVREMYPEGEQTRVSVSPLSTGLCGVSRPEHFGGVATVVAKLFNAAGPGVYIFGRKDYQQWRLIERMARDLLFPVEVLGMPLVREPDGLAMSSRNAYLSPAERAQALAICRGLMAAQEAYQGGESDLDGIVRRVRAVLESAGLAVEYVESRDALTLDSLSGTGTGSSVLLAVAARAGTTRLIDNVVLSRERMRAREGAAT